MDEQTIRMRIRALIASGALPTDPYPGMTREQCAVRWEMRMPQMTGEVLYRHIEHGWPRLAPRFVFMTAERLSRAFLAQYGGTVPILTKPFTREQIRQVVSNVIARAA